MHLNISNTSATVTTTILIGCKNYIVFTVLTQHKLFYKKNMAKEIKRKREQMDYTVVKLHLHKVVQS